MTAASGVVERRATFSVLEVDGIYGVDGEQFAEHELRRVAAVVPAGQMQRGRLVLARLGVQNYNRSINQPINIRLTNSCMHGLAPAYLAETLDRAADVDSRRRLSSGSPAALLVPMTRRRTLGDCAFPVAAAQVSVEQSAYHTDFTVITANVQAAAQDIPVRAVVFVTFLLHCLRQL